MILTFFLFSENFRHNPPISKSRSRSLGLDYISGLQCKCRVKHINLLILMQLYEGVWVEDIPKCGAMIDFGREGAPQPTQYPIPEVSRESELEY